MSNRLKMPNIESILALRRRGWSFVRIAKELGLHRETVARYVHLSSKPAEAPPGSDDSKPAEAPPGSDSKPTQVHSGSGLRVETRSDCEPHRAIIQQKLDLGLDAKRIHQDLVAERQFEGSYWSVMRFVRRLWDTHPLPFRRMECEPGEEAQVDFGTGAPVVTVDGQRRKTHVFRIVLSHSRKGYSEAVYRQTTENFIRALENAFRHFGGSVRTLVIDNLRAAVQQADWYEPELHPRLQSFCRHYGVVILPTRPYMPRHKGKIEAGVKYVKRNALKARHFESLEAQNDFLLHWETTVADKRIHGTTQQQVAKLYEEVERRALMPLPVERFPFFYEGQRRVHRDGHVEVDHSYYSAPPEYFRRTVWVRWDSRLVRMFNDQMEEICVHIKQPKRGSFSTHPAHIAAEKISGIERGTEWLLQRARCIGPHADRWAQEVIRARRVEGVRTVLGLVSLAKRQPCDAIDKACEIALSYGVLRLRSIRKLIERQAPKQEQLEFMQEHPIIRSIDVYGDLVKAALHAPPPSWQRENGPRDLSTDVPQQTGERA
jgi:transposase